MINKINEINNLSEESKNVLSIIQKKGPITKKDIIKLTGYKLTSLNRFMKPIIEMSLINNVGVEESTGGRKPYLYDIDKDKYCIIGIDISRTYTNVVLTNLKMNIIKKYHMKMDKTSTPQNIIKVIKELISKWKQELKNKCLLGIGIGTVGPLDRNNGKILNPQNFPANGWNNFNLVDRFKDEFKVPITIDNGVNMAVLAEHDYGIGKGIDNIAYVNCGMGIRSGVIIDKNIIRATNNKEDAFAHMIIDINGDKCICGANGCIESISSIYSIIKNYIKEIKKLSKSSIHKSINNIDYKYICRAAENGDEIAKSVIVKAAEGLGIGISNFIKILNIQLVILSGPLVECSHIFYDRTISAAAENYYKFHNNKISFVKEGYFKKNSIAVGAAANLFESMLKKVY